MPAPADNRSDLNRIYEGARELFLRGKHDRALERFESIYEVDVTFRDIASIINDYYDDASKEKWIAKYEAHFRAQNRSD